MDSDRAIVSRVLKGDMQAFQLIIHQNQQLVRHMIGRLVKNQDDLEELCQDVFMKVYQKLSGFQFESKLSTWIARIAYNLSINHLKKKKLPISEEYQNEEGKTVSTHFITEENPESIISETDLQKFMRAEIEKLPPVYKTILTLFHLESMQIQEIMEVLQMPEGTVKNYLFRARNILKERLKLSLKNEELI